jgi:hypothetical protein
MTDQQRLQVFVVGAGLAVLALALLWKHEVPANDQYTDTNRSGGNTEQFPITMGDTILQTVPQGLDSNNYTVNVSGCPCTPTTDTFFASSLKALETSYLSKVQNLEDDYLSAVRNNIPAYLVPMINNYSGAIASEETIAAYQSL